MGSVVRNNDDRDYLCNLVFDIVDNGIDKEKVEEMLKHLLPKDNEGKLLVDYNIRVKKGKAGAYYPKFNIVNVSVPGLVDWVEEVYNSIVPMYEIKEVNIFKAYLYLSVLIHEIEHSYQFMIAAGKVPAPCKMVEQGYRTITEIIVPKKSFLPRPIKEVRTLISGIAYKCKEYYYVMERNAEVAALGTVEDIALTNGHEEAREILLDMKKAFSIVGYMENNDGTLINTIKGVLMGDKLRKIEHDYESMDMMERYEWGLPIDDETRKLVFTRDIKKTT